MAGNDSIDLVVIDDQVAIIAILKAALGTLGYRRVEGARSGSEGLETIRTVQPHAVVCDINMPGMNGLEVLKEVRSGRAGIPEALPFIFLTGHSESEVVRVALELDANGFIKKPVAPKDLDQRLNRILSSKPKVKDRTVYASVVIPEVNLSGVTMPPTLPQSPMRGVEHAVKSLPDRAILTADVQTHSGSVLVASGSVVTAEMRDKLGDLVDIGVIPSTTRIEG